jgi:pilus assembly protein FimV
LLFARRLHLGDALKNRSGHAGRVALNTIALAAMVAASGSTWALGLGRLNVQSALGEALRAEIDITSLTPEEDSSLRVRIAPPDSYRASGVDYNAVLTSTTVTVARRADGRPYLRVTSDRAVQEPFVDVILELTWSSGRLVREYTLLLDPPQSRVAPPAMAQAPAAPQISPAPQAAAPVPSQGAVATAPTPPAATPTPRPAPAPRAATAQRPSPVAPAGAPSGEGEYKVKEGDTLYRIAKGNQRANVSLDQMLVALFRNNPNAFIGDNMNRLKAGAVLNVPSSEQASAVTTADAKETIRAQSADFGAYRQRLAGNVPTTPASESSRQAAGKVQAAIDDRKQAAATTPDKLTLSQGAVKPGAASTEAKVSKESEKKDAATRVAELAKNIEDLKKVQKEAPPATAPAQPAAPAPAAPATPPAPEAKAPAPAPVTPAPAPAQGAQAPAEPPKTEPATPSVPLPAPATPAPEAAASEPAAAPKPAAPKAAPPAPVEEPSMLAALTDNAYAVPGGIGLAVLLAGLALYRLRGRFRKDNGETSFLESRLQPDSFFGASGGQRVDTRDAASGVSSSMSYSLSQLDAIGDVDPVAEADVYLAYGRDLQAEEILKEAMRGNPDRLAIRTKLLEVYAKRRDTKGFEMLATQLYSLTKGEGDDWAKAQELGRQIDPENPLYRPGGAPVANVGDGGRIIEPLGASTMPQSIMPHTSGFSTSTIDSMSGTDSRPAPDLDLDLDLGTMPSPSAPSRRDAQPSQPVLDLESISLDLNPSASMPLSSGTQAASNNAKPALDFGDFTLPAQPSQHSAFDDNDPLARKLELAEEFRQIGDMEGARDLLEEVVAKAGGALKTKAQSMLDNLA